jgi:hypothetical protein
MLDDIDASPLLGGSAQTSGEIVKRIGPILPDRSAHVARCVNSNELAYVSTWGTFDARACPARRCPAVEGRSIWILTLHGIHEHDAMSQPCDMFVSMSHLELLSFTGSNSSHLRMSK